MREQGRALLRRAALTLLTDILRSRMSLDVLKIGLNTSLGFYLSLLILDLIINVRWKRILCIGLAEILGSDTQALTDFAYRHFLKRPSADRFDTTLLLSLESNDFATAEALLKRPGEATYLRREVAVHARIVVSHELAFYAETVAAAKEMAFLGGDATQNARRNHDFLRAAYAAAMLLNHDLALWFFSLQYGGKNHDLTKSEWPTVFSEEAVKIVRDLVIDNTLRNMPAEAHRALASAERVGIFFLNAPQALGHAILDPYHFLALYRERYDRIFFLGSDLNEYSPATRTCIEIVSQHGRYYPVEDSIQLNLSWMFLGDLKVGNLEIIVQNYWSLLRQACHRAANPGDGYKPNNWFLALPECLDAVGRKFCEQMAIDLAQPIIVLHARDHGYHGIQKQAFRNSPIEDYRRAIDYLLEAGYQVIRLGDAKMPKLPIQNPKYYELPFMLSYESALDPFFVYYARFLIGSQSGPCSYARAFGTPILSINAVFSYTLLTGKQEMGCFKRYRVTENARTRNLSYTEIFDQNLFQYENKYQFDYLGISFENCTEEEILAAVKDMEIWVNAPDSPLTVEQQAFRAAATKTALRLRQAGNPDLPIADSLGIALPGYRISPTVELMRGAMLTSDGPKNAPPKSDAE